ncbi:tyrosine-type recombinase/integrase [Halopenitus persicus]|uniref:tyrosine-type recombinase/integrase n=1 Tax=Halopenitus persicus TaxID=1048396 RepID=UPI000B87665D|nr:tyrosine-type recombinase/integrase [Halopenitus persicus]
MSSNTGDQSEVISSEQLSLLNNRQSEIYSAKLARFANYLQKEGKNPKKKVGYADTAVEKRVYRVHRAVKWFWNQHEIKTEITTDDADKVNRALEVDQFCKGNGEPYAEGSKRKFNDALRNWFEFQNVDWTPEYEFSDTEAKKENKPDPFTRPELKQLWETSLTYKSIPSYNNLTPDERDRWKTHIAQELGKPKETVVPDDWDRINNDWHIPSLIRTARSHGWRPDLVGRMKVQWYEPSEKTIYIPEGEAPKNDTHWRADLTDEGALALDKWLDQRELMELYDGRDVIWLTRKGNPYSSGTLNDLLRNLMDEAGIKSQGRNLVWYSFRHSIGTYVFAETKSLKVVADQLRQKSRASAEKYVHPLPEVKREAANIM